MSSLFLIKIIIKKLEKYLEDSKKVANFASLFGRKPCEAFSGILSVKQYGGCSSVG